MVSYKKYRRWNDLHVLFTLFSPDNQQVRNAVSLEIPQQVCKGLRTVKHCFPEKITS